MPHNIKTAPEMGSVTNIELDIMKKNLIILDINPLDEDANLREFR